MNNKRALTTERNLVTEKENMQGGIKSVTNSVQKTQTKTPLAKSTLMPTKSQSLPAIPLKDKSNAQLKMPNKVVKVEKRPKLDLVKLLEVPEEEKDTFQIIKKFKLDEYFVDVPVKIEDLFVQLEEKGLLSEEILLFFGKNKEIKAISLSASYAPVKNEINMLVMKPLSIERSTIPFYKNYEHLKILNLSNVPIRDEQLRYLITLSLDALGLSGTEITNKGLNYLGKHAKMSNSLSCLKLCYIPHLNDKTIDLLCAFKSLKEIDLLGVPLTVKSIDSFFKNDKLIFETIRLPAALFVYLRDKHVAFYSERDLSIPLDESLSASQVKLYLKKLKPHYENVYLNLSEEESFAMLGKLLERRRKEEILWKSL